MSTWWQKPHAHAQNTHLPRYPARSHANPLSPDTRFVAIAAAVVLCVTASLPLRSAQATTTPVGTTPGSFNVANGAASYSIPITVPPGVNGLAPSLSLTYSSQGGNGLLGMGGDRWPVRHSSLWCHHRARWFQGRCELRCERQVLSRWPTSH